MIDSTSDSGGSARNPHTETQTGSRTRPWPSASSTAPTSTSIRRCARWRCVTRPWRTSSGPRPARRSRGWSTSASPSASTRCCCPATSTDGDQTSMRTALFLGAGLKRLDGAGIAAFVIRGNHDHMARITKELVLPAERPGVRRPRGGRRGRDRRRRRRRPRPQLRAAARTRQPPAEVPRAGRGRGQRRPDAHEPRRFARARPVRALHGGGPRAKRLPLLGARARPRALGRRGRLHGRDARHAAGPRRGRMRREGRPARDRRRRRVRRRREPSDQRRPIRTRRRRPLRGAGLARGRGEARRRARGGEGGAPPPTNWSLACP